jgi:hypothetical protein
MNPPVLSKQTGFLKKNDVPMEEYTILTDDYTPYSNEVELNFNESVYRSVNLNESNVNIRRSRSFSSKLKPLKVIKQNTF